MKDREYRCSECLQLQKEKMEYPYVCDGCEGKKDKDFEKRYEIATRKKNLWTPIDGY